MGELPCGVAFGPGVFAGAILFVCGTLLMSQVRSLWQLYLFFGLLMAAGAWISRPKKSS